MKNKVLFFLNSLPHRNTAGGMLYNQVLESYGPENVSVIGVSFPQENSFNSSSNNKQFRLRFPENNLFWKVLKKISILEDLFVLIKYLIIKKKVIDHLKKTNPEIILFQLRGDSLFFLKSVFKHANIPIVAMIEDTVEREIDGSYLSYLIKKRLYYKYISKMSKIGVAGETMQNYIQSSFKIESIIIRPWSERMNVLKMSKKVVDGKINLFFGGNIYAKKEFKLFLKALDLFLKNNKKYDFNFFIASRKKIDYQPENYKITELGWIKESALREYMDISHFSYLPYIFDSKYEHSMMYAFPSKAGFYITNNLPIFFHGPVHSSFNTFLKSHKVGVSCSSLEINDVVTSISTLIADGKECFSSFNNAIDIAYKTEYTQEQFDNRVKKLFEVI